MTRPSVSILALRCPTCGGDLPAVGEDLTFLCPPCGTGLAPDDDGRGLHTVPAARRPPEKDPGDAPVIHLPYWWFPIEVEVRGPDSLVRKVSDRSAAWVAAWPVPRASLAKEPGPLFTRACVEHRPAPAAGVRMVGASRPADTAAELLPWQLLQVVDAEVDVTHLELDVTPGDPVLTAVPFTCHGRHLHDLLLGLDHPGSAVAHFDAIRAFHGLPPA